MQSPAEQVVDVEELRWKKFPVGSAGFVCLVDWMGDDDSIVQAARTSYGKGTKKVSDDRNLIRYLYRHSHTTPFEMVEFKFLVKVPMDIWRQWIRHRTASVNEYSTRYSEAMDECAMTHRDAWRLQSPDNKQGSSGFLTEWPDSIDATEDDISIRGQPVGEYLAEREEDLHRFAKEIYKERLDMGIAKEQARKDLPLSNYTQAYWKCDLKNLLNFLSLRMDSHAQLEIRQFAEAMYEIVKQVCPLAIEAFDEYDFRRGGMMLSATEIKFIQLFCDQGSLQDIELASFFTSQIGEDEFKRTFNEGMAGGRPNGMWGGHLFDKVCLMVGWSIIGKHREREEMRAKLERMGLLLKGTKPNERRSTAGNEPVADATTTAAQAEEQPPTSGGADVDQDQGNRESSTIALQPDNP